MYVSKHTDQTTHVYEFLVLLFFSGFGNVCKISFFNNWSHKRLFSAGGLITTFTPFPESLEDSYHTKALKGQGYS